MARTLEELMAKESPKFVTEAKAKASSMLLEIHLAELRKKAQITQID